MRESVFRIWTLAPGAPRAPEVPCCRLRLLAVGQRSGRKAAWLFGWWMHLSWETTCFLNRHKNIICSEEINSHTNVMNVFLVICIVYLWDSLCIKELGSVDKVRALNLCSQAHLGEYLSCPAVGGGGKSCHVSKRFEEEFCLLGLSWLSDCRNFFFFPPAS